MVKKHSTEIFVILLELYVFKKEENPGSYCVTGRGSSAYIHFSGATGTGCLCHKQHCLFTMFAAAPP
jgi:hypothetical protein